MKKLIVVLLILGLAAAPAMAAEVTFSGSHFVQYTWTSVDSENDANAEFEGYQGVLSFPKNGKSTTIKANWKASDSLSGQVLLAQGGANGIGGGNSYSSENAYFKDTFAKWNFGAGNLKFGYYGGSATNFVAFPAGLDDSPWIFEGSFVMDRSTGMALEFGGFTFELKENYGAGLAGAYSDADVLIPQIQAAYAYGSKLLFIKASGIFQTYSVEDNANEESETINTLGASLTGRVNLGPAYISTGAWYMQNGSHAHVLTYGGGGPVNRAAMIDADGVVNYTAMSISLAGGVQISPKLGIHAGIVYNSGAYDDGDHTDYSTNAFLNVKTSIGPILFTPEIGYKDGGENAGVDADKTLYVTGQFKVFW